MKLIEIGRHGVNLEHLIRFERGPLDDLPENSIRVFMLSGDRIEFQDKEAQLFLEAVRQVMMPTPQSFGAVEVVAAGAKERSKEAPRRSRRSG